MAQKVEVEDFSGGITDYYLSAPPNKVKQCDNLLINQYQDQGKVFTRPGSRLYDALWPNISTANRINTCFYYNDKLFVQAASKLFYYKTNTDVSVDRWVKIDGYNEHDAFPSATGNDQFTYAHWNYHTLIANSSSYGYPMKVTLSENVPTLRQAGLPKFDPNPNDPNSLKIKFTNGAGSKNYLYKFAYRREYLSGPNIGGSQTKFVDIGTPSLSVNVFNCAEIGPYIGGAVTISNIPVLSNTADTNYDTSNIKIDIYRTLNNGTVFYLVGTIANGTTTFVDNIQDSIKPILGFDSQLAFPATGSADYLYYARDTKKYYKWTGSSYLLWTNDSLDAHEPLYTTGGVIENDPPPKCKSIHIRGDIAYYGNVVESDGTNYFRLRQSVPGDIDSVPETFYVDVDDEIVAVSSTKNNVVLLCKNNAYRVDGFFDELGRGGMTVERISDTAGCISSQCAVQALDGVFWLGKEAAYFTDGFKVIKVNQDYDKTYKTITQTDANNVKFQGKYDKKKNRIWWTIQEPNKTDLNKCYVLDLNWGIRENATFTTVSGASFVPTAIEFVNGDMIRCNQFGHVLIHQDTLFVDPKIDGTVAPSQWVDETILYTLETCAYNFGTSATRKYVTQANVTCESTTNLSLQIVSNNDDNRIVADLLPIRYRGNIIWGEPDVYWGDVTLDWNRQGLIHEKRLMPAKSLRCNYKSLKFQNAKVGIVSSDIIGTATIDQAANTVTLTNIASYDWPTKVIGYFISFEHDGYQREYEIISRTDDVLTYADPLNTSQSGLGQKWVIRGKPLGETLNLFNFSVVYEVSGPSLNPYRTSNSGEVST